MGLLSWIRGLFGKSKAKPASLPKVAYFMAYYVISDYCLNHRERLLHMCSGPPRLAKIFYYVMACQSLKMEPKVEDAELFEWHQGKLDDGREYLVLEYPKPDPIQVDPALLEKSSPQRVSKLLADVTMAPFFSGVAYDAQGEARYLVLAQSLLPGRYTLREAFGNGSHGSVGDGPSPSLANFLACFSEERQIQTLFEPG